MMDIEEATPAVEEREAHEMHPMDSAIPHGSFVSTISSTSCTISYTPSAKIYLYALILLTCLALVVGGAFTSIFIEDRNILGAVSAFIQTSISLGTLSIFLMHLFKRVEKYHDQGTLNGLKLLGIIVSIVSGIALGVYTIQAFLLKQGFDFRGENYFSAAVSSGLCLATSIKLFIVAQWYQSALERSKLITTLSAPSTSRTR